MLLLRQSGRLLNKFRKCQGTDYLVLPVNGIIIRTAEPYKWIGTHGDANPLNYLISWNFTPLNNRQTTENLVSKLLAKSSVIMSFLCRSYTTIKKKNA